MSAHTSMGLDGTIVAQTQLGLIDGTAGRLSFCGYSVHDLADSAQWEEVLHLLWHGDLPTSGQLAALRANLAAARALTPEEIALVRGLPRVGHAMDVLRAAVSLLAGLHQPTTMRADTIFADGLRLAAKLPMLVAAYARLREGREPVQPDADLGHAAAFLHALHGRRPAPEEEAALNTYMVLLAEHGLNVATFVARVVASAQNDLYTAIDAAMAALKGISHGGANEHAMRAFLSIGDPADAPAFIKDLLARKARLMGVGHRIYQTEDPRVRHLRQHSAALAARSGADSRAHAVAEAVAASIIDHPHFQARKLYPNVEFYSAPLLYQLGLPLDTFTLAFAMARLPGWVGHVREQLGVARLVRPEAEYVGPAPRAFVALEDR
ncbi:tungsten formylmethanofuran dehydrogenase [Chloroflexales bacterium ZM16-3]|nr:tungsten formylmethanofuran dehydrogenase [Chloroflexales bacterium ZM16-3]